MKQLIAAIALSVVMFPAFAQKPCEELKSEISAKIESKGIKIYQLEIIAPNEVKDQRVVGSCDGGSKRIVYARKAPDTHKGPDTPKDPNTGKATDTPN